MRNVFPLFLPHQGKRIEDEVDPLYAEYRRRRRLRRGSLSGTCCTDSLPTMLSEPPACQAWLRME